MIQLHAKFESNNKRKVRGKNTHNSYVTITIFKYVLFSCGEYVLGTAASPPLPRSNTA